GYATPLIQTVSTFTGAVPVTCATLLPVVTAGLTANDEAFTAASCEAMLVCAWESHGLMLVTGFSTLRPLAVKALYLASSSGPLLATLSGPFTNSCKARQYMRRKVGLL